MSQQVSMDLVSASGGNSTYQIESCLVKIKADNLIDEVFKALETDLQQSQSLSAELISSSHRFSESTATQAVDGDLLVAYAPASAPSVSKDKIFPASESIRASGDLEKQEAGWERWLFRFACTSLAMSVVLWAASQFYLPKPASTVSLAPAQPPQPQGKPVDIDFAAYMLRALDVIDRQKPATTLAQVPSPPQLPPLPVAPIAMQVQPPPIQSSGVAAVQPLPQQPIPVVRLPQPPQLTPGHSSSTAARTPSQASVTAAIPAVPPPKATVHNLVGILELGDRSIALVEVNGATQRIPIGQSIGTSGWRLIQITEQKAVVERSGAIRSIFVGQQF